MPISPSFFKSSRLFASRFVRRAKNTCKASKLSMSHIFLRKWSHSDRPGSPEAAGWTASTVSKALRSRRKGRDCNEARSLGCDFKLFGSSWLRIKDRIGIVEEVGTIASVYSSTRAKRPIFEGVRKRVMAAACHVCSRLDRECLHSQTGGGLDNRHRFRGSLHLEVASRRDCLTRPHQKATPTPPLR